jgi:hypothetical protein
MRGPSKLFSALVIGAMLALPGSAFAASSSESAYNQPGGTVQDQIETRPASSTGTTPSAAVTTPAQANSDDGGKLPFTGLDLALVVGAGGILLLLGFGIRRFTTGSELA